MRSTTALVLLAWLLAAGTATAQTETAPPAPAEEGSAGAAPDAAAAGPEVPLGFTYDPGERRDPFVSLLFRGGDTPATGTRAGGLAGLSASEVSLRGTLRSGGVWVGILQGADGKNYTVRAGDRLADGTVQAISAEELVVTQQVNDPLSLEREREVRKMLRQSDEAR